MNPPAVVITGATGHLGSALARGFAANGWTVLANARSAPQVERLVELITTAGGAAFPAVFDVADDDSVQSFFAGLEPGPVNSIVNGAYSGKAGTIETSSSQDYADASNLAVGAAHRVMKAALPHLRAARSLGQDANVINVASMYGLVSPDLRVYPSADGANPPFYGAAKAALLQWTRYAAVEFGREGIRVNSLTPGPFPNPDVVSASPDFVAQLASKTPLGRVGRAEELVAPALFLASAAASFVTGTNLVVDGGWTSW